MIGVSSASCLRKNLWNLFCCLCCTVPQTDRGFVSSNADEATRFEMYYPPFQGAIEAGVASAMVSFSCFFLSSASL